MEQALVIRRDGGNWDVRVVRRRERWWKRWWRAWREHRTALQLAELDERTLKDVGLERFARCGSARITMARLGLM
jgi:hypothetical protein